MHTEAVHKAEGRLTRAREAAGKLTAAVDSPDAAEEAWSDFIMSAGSIYSILEQGAKRTGKSKAWFGRKLHERRTDPLLKYIHYARNADEHGFRKITVRRNSHVKLAPGATAIFESDGVDTWSIVAQEGGIDYPHDRIALVRVHNEKFGDWCDPPLQHLGNPTSRHPAEVAQCAVMYLEKMLQDARALV